VGAVLASFPEVTGLREPRPGSYRARNLGLLHSRGEVLAFTDSDCLPAADWLERGVNRVLGDPGGGFVGGHIQLFARDPDKPTAVELHQLLFDLRQGALLLKEGFAATANMLTRRSTIDRAGPFNALLKSGGDYEWGNRVTAMGMPGVYAPEVVVRHPARRTYHELGKKVRRLAGARYDGRTKVDEDKAWPGLKAFLPPIGTLKRIFTDSSFATPATRARILPVVLFVWLTGATEDLRLLAGGHPRRS
jgi:glycosyltransferase involved in cell wall biosynthesis